jgi:octaprenyl-diphosphate synthase
VFWERVIEDHEQEDADLEEALSLIDAADGLEETKARARQYGQDAKDALAVLPQTPVTHALGDVVDFVISRAY